MSNHKGNITVKPLIVIIIALMIIAVISLMIIKTGRFDAQKVQQGSHSQGASSSQPKVLGIEAKTEVRPDLTLSQIARNARQWQPSWIRWFGKSAPDFKLADINGKEHRLSDYKGRNTFIIFWATWCQPCLYEIPFLIKLREETESNELAMLAISFESADTVAGFTKRSKMNYTVFAAQPYMLPEPFNRIQGIPSAFFIDPDGKIKFATVGLLQIEEIKAILKAKN